MKKFCKVVGSSLLLGAGLLVPALANAQEVGLRAEAGVAIPMASPQVDRFDPGVDVAVRPFVNVSPYVDLGPVVSFLALPSTIEGVDAGTAWSVGLGLRVKKPHDHERNQNVEGIGMSPWLDGDLRYVMTDDLERPGVSLGAGLSIATDDDRDLWIGPFARYVDVIQQSKAGFDSTDAHLLVLGVSVEVGATQKPKRVAPKPECPPPPQPQPPVEAPKDPPPMVSQDVEMELKQVVQFAWDSPVLDKVATAQLQEVVGKLTAAKSFGAIKVEGHASSEGQVEHNKKLAQKRAQSVVDFLVANGVPQEKVSASGFGSSVPVGDNKTEPGRVKNRRAEFVVKFVVVKEGK